MPYQLGFVAGYRLLEKEINEDQKTLTGYAIDFTTWVLENLVIEESKDKFRFFDDPDFIFDIDKAHELFLKSKE